MKFDCPHCEAHYSIAPNKVQGKVLKIRCKRCSYILTVQGPRGTSPLPAQEAPRQTQGIGPLATMDGPSGALPRPVFGDTQMSAAPDLSPAPARCSLIPESAVQARASAPTDDPLLVTNPVEQTRLCAAPDFDVVSAPQQAPQSAEEPWYLAVDGAQFGPMDRAELCNRIRRGEAGDEAFVWREGYNDWLDIAQVPDLPRQPPPPPVSEPPLDCPAPSPAGEPAPTEAEAEAASPLAPTAPAPGPAPEPAPQQAAPQARIPLLMKVTAAGGITAGLCGIILVVHILFLDGPRPAAPPPVLKIVVPETATDRKALEKVEPGAGEARAKLPSRTHERKVTDTQRPRTRASRARRPKKQTRDPGLSLPSIPAPRRLVDVPRTDVSRPPADLSAQVQALQRSNKKRIRSCYERAAKHDNSLETVKAKFALDIGGSGVVRGVDVDAGGNAYLRGCLKKIVKHWTFPGGGAQILKFNILFKGTPKRY